MLYKHKDYKSVQGKYVEKKNLYYIFIQKAFIKKVIYSRDGLIIKSEDPHNIIIRLSNKLD